MEPTLIEVDYYVDQGNALLLRHLIRNYARITKISNTCPKKTQVLLIYAGNDVTGDAGISVLVLNPNEMRKRDEAVVLKNL